MDLAGALINAPEAVVRLLSHCAETEVDAVLALETEMNFLWGVTPVRAWRDAFEGRKAYLVKLMNALPIEDADRYARDELNSILQAIVARQPALALHAQGVVTRLEHAVEIKQDRRASPSAELQTAFVPAREACRYASRDEGRGEHVPTQVACSVSSPSAREETSCSTFIARQVTPSSA